MCHEINCETFTDEYPREDIYIQDWKNNIFNKFIVSCEIESWKDFIFRRLIHTKA